jgi:hypothetical protein
MIQVTAETGRMPPLAFRNSERQLTDHTHPKPASPQSAKFGRNADCFKCTKVGYAEVRLASRIADI